MHYIFFMSSNIKKKDIIITAYKQGMSHKEIQQKYHFSANTIKSAIYRYKNKGNDEIVTILEAVSSPKKYKKLSRSQAPKHKEEKALVDGYLELVQNTIDILNKELENGNLDTSQAILLFKTISDVILKK